MHYRLDEDHKLVPCTVDEWAQDLRKGPVRVGKDILPNGGMVSTVFLGLDHSIGTGLPMVFESMYFPLHNNEAESWIEEDCERCSTWDEAVEQHAKMVAKYLKQEEMNGDEAKEESG